MNRLRITSNGHPRDAAVDVDGQDISAMTRGVDLHMRVGEFPTAVVELNLNRGAEFAGDAIVRLAPEAEQLLKALGWTPPGEE